GPSGGRDGRAGIEREARVDFGGSPPWNRGENLTTNGHQQSVEPFSDGSVGMLAQHPLQYWLTRRALCRFQDECRVSGGIRWPIGANGIKVARIGNDDGMLAQGL